MKFGIQRDALLKPLQHVNGVVERKQAMPILSNVLFSCSPNGLSLTGTDLELEMVAHVHLEGAESGSVTVPARKLSDIVKALPEGSHIQCALEGERFTVRSGKSRFTLSTLPAIEFPAMETNDNLFSLRVPQKHLKVLLDRTAFAMAQQDVRYYLNGLLLEVEDNTLRTVATDGHRLALCEIGTEHNPPEGIRVIVPRKGVNELSRLLDDSEDPVELEIGRNHLRVRLGELTFTSKLIDGKFPDYERVVPVDNRNVVTADRLTLRETLRRASILSNEKYRGIRIQLRPGVLNALAHNPEQEEAEEEFAVDYNGPELEIGFNASYLLDALGAVESDTVHLRFADSSSSCLLDGPDEFTSRYVIMPMRL